MQAGDEEEEVRSRERGTRMSDAAVGGTNRRKSKVWPKKQKVGKQSWALASWSQAGWILFFFCFPTDFLHLDEHEPFKQLY